MKPEAKNFQAVIGSGDYARTITFETGKLAGQAGGAVTIRLGDTIAFAAANLDLVCCATERPEEIHASTLLLVAGRDPITVNGRTKTFVERIGLGPR